MNTVKSANEHRRRSIERGWTSWRCAMSGASRRRAPSSLLTLRASCASAAGTGEREPDLEAHRGALREPAMSTTAAYALAKSQSLSGRGYGKRRAGRRTLRVAGVDEDDGAAARDHADGEAVVRRAAVCRAATDRPVRRSRRARSDGAREGARGDGPRGPRLRACTRDRRLCRRAAKSILIELAERARATANVKSVCRHSHTC